METALKVLALWGVLLCGVARAQFIFDLKQPRRSGKKFALYLGAVYVNDSNVYLDESSPAPDQIVRGLAALSYETETTNRFFRLGYEFIYPYYIENVDLMEPQHSGLVMYDQALPWGKVFVSDEFRLISDPVDTTDPFVYKGKMTRMVNRLDPRVRLKLGRLGIEASGAWEFSDYSPSALDYLDYDDYSFCAEAIFESKGKWEAFGHLGLGWLRHETPGVGGGDDYDQTRLCGGIRGEPSAKLGYELAGGLLIIKPKNYANATDYFLSLRATWEPTPGINRLLLGYRRDVRPSALPPYAIVNKAEASYGHWLMSRIHVELGGFYEASDTPKVWFGWETVGAFAGLRYEFRKFRYLFGRGEFRARDSNVADASYVDVRLMGGFVYRF